MPTNRESAGMLKQALPLPLCIHDVRSSFVALLALGSRLTVVMDVKVRVSRLGKHQYSVPELDSARPNAANPAHLSPRIKFCCRWRITNLTSMQVSCLPCLCLACCAISPPLGSNMSDSCSISSRGKCPRAPVPVASQHPGRLKAGARPMPGRSDEQMMHGGRCMQLPPYRRWSAVGCLHRHITARGGLRTSKAGEGTRCRRARTSCQERTCGRLRFVIGQCAPGRSPTCTPRMREGASWPLAEEGGRGLPTCRWCRDSLLKRLCGAGKPRVRILFSFGRRVVRWPDSTGPSPSHVELGRDTPWAPDTVVQSWPEIR